VDWQTLLAYVTGSVDEHLLLRIEYLVAENGILRAQIPGRLHLSDAERTTLAALGKKLGKQALEEVANVAKPDTILAWHRKLVAHKFDGSAQRKARGRPQVDKALEDLVIQMAKENRAWGYDRIAGALAHLGYTISDQSVGNILKRRGLPPAPDRKKTTTWREFVRSHLDVLVATDFFTTEVWTLGGLVTFYVLFFIEVGSRRVHIAGVTPHTTAPWMMQMARNVTMDEWGFLKPGQYLIHDRDSKFCAAFKQLIDEAGVNRIPLPPRSPYLNAYAERWVRSVKEEALSRFVLFGERALWHILNQYVSHYHQERPHQGKGNVLLFPSVRVDHGSEGPIQCRERLGGLLKYYHRSQYRWSPRQYADVVQAVSRGVPLDWCVSMDYACEPAVDRSLLLTNRRRIEATLQLEHACRHVAPHLPWLLVLEGNTRAERVDDLARRQHEGLVPRP
jgi:transposase InsO family protein